MFRTIYYNWGVFVLSTDEVLELASAIEHAKIDIKKTVEKTATAGYLAEEQAYCTVIQEREFTYLVSNLFGDEYGEFKLDNFYFDIISKALDDEGIYISLAYCHPNLNVPLEHLDEVIEYDEYLLDEDDLYYLREFTLITADETKVFKIYEEEGIPGHKPTEDLGLIVKYNEGVYSFYFALRSIDLCGSSIRVLPLSNEYPMEHELSFSNPVNRLMVEMISNVLVFEE